MKTGVLMLIIIALLTGCSRGAEKTDALSENTAGESSGPVIRMELSELEIQNMFLAYAEAGWIMVDCVPVTDSDYGIIGVVQYTTCEDKGCCFDFLKLNGPMKIGVGARPAGEDRLVYMGGDTISCELLKNGGEIYTCTVSYYETESEIGFSISE